MTKTILTAATVALGLGMTQASAQTNQEVAPETQNSKKGNVVGRVFNDMKESTRKVHAINKENIAEIKYAYWEMHTEATEPHPGMMKVKEAKGFKNKIKAIGLGMKQSANEQSEKEKLRREQIQSHESYKQILEMQRTQLGTIISRS